jgi:hydroxyacylglutathione hydrolase
MVWFYAQIAALVFLLPGAAVLLLVGAVVTTQKRGSARRRSACACHGLPGFHAHTGMLCVGEGVNESVSLLSRFLYLFYNSALGQYYWDHKIDRHRREEGAPHTRTETVRCGAAFFVHPVAVEADNYAYLLVDAASGEVAAVDPADPAAVLKAMQRLEHEGIIGGGRPLRLTTVLTTHGHYDHDGGNAALRKQFPGIRVVGGAGDGVIGATVQAKHGDIFVLGGGGSDGGDNGTTNKRQRGSGGVQINVLKTPCHTPHHVCYHVTEMGGDSEHHALFSGDTLFVGGVGKFFEGSGEAMARSLFDVLLGTLPAETKLFCGHEYTVQNLKFAQLAEPENTAIREKLEWSERQRLDKKQTMPSTLGEELAYNPFLRVAQGPRRAAVLSALRSAKDEGLDTEALVMGRVNAARLQME